MIVTSEIYIHKAAPRNAFTHDSNTPLHEVTIKARNGQKVCFGLFCTPSNLPTQKSYPLSVVRIVPSQEPAQDEVVEIPGDIPSPLREIVGRL